MEQLSFAHMETIEGGGPLLAGALIGLAWGLLFDNDFIQGVADGIVGAPRH